MNEELDLSIKNNKNSYSYDSGDDVDSAEDEVPDYRHLASFAK